MPIRNSEPRSGCQGARAALAALLAGLLLGACGGQRGPASGFDLRLSLAAADTCSISVPDATVLGQLRQRLARRLSKRWNFELALADPPQAARGRDPRIWIGTAKTPGCEVALSRLGVQAVAAGGFRFLGADYAGDHDGLIATVGDPGREGAVLEIVLGNQPSLLLDNIDDWTPTSRMGWQAIRGGAIEREGAVEPGGAPAAQPAIDVAAFEAQLFATEQRDTRKDFDWVAGSNFDTHAAKFWFAGLDLVCAGVDKRLSAVMPFDAELRLSLRIFETPEELARVCRARGFARVRPLASGFEVALVHGASWPDNAAFELAHAWAAAVAEPPRAEWLLDGVAAAGADAWFGRPLKSWLAHLWAGDLIPSVALLMREGAPLSPHIAAPLRGALLLCCEELHGPDFAARNWAANAETIVPPGDEEFRAWLEHTIADEIEPARRARVERRAASLALATRRGACLVASPAGADPFAGGFGSRDCAQSLGQLRDLGASSVALSWCSALEQGEPRMFGAGRQSWTQADDAALYSAILRARALGLGVVLLPQLVATENGGWAGQVLLTTSRSQREWFEAWRRSVTHLGLLAELAGVDVLSLGSEAPDTVVTRESDENRRRHDEFERLRTDWQLLVASGRAAFCGGLTYAARWDGEAQGIEFWNQLDFLGQNVFVPLAEADSQSAPSTDEITQRIFGAFGHLSQMAKEQGVLPLVCGIGISSTAQGWREPSRPLGPLDLDLQSRFYDGLVRALQLARRQSLTPAGLFSWYWSSDPAAGGEQDRGFSTQHKPAQAALARALHVR